MNSAIYPAAAAVKDVMGDLLVTVFPRQGHYALDPANIARYPAADCAIDAIGHLLTLDIAARLVAPT